MTLSEVECTTFLKPFSVAGFTWPPRGATIRATYIDPQRPSLAAELKVDMVDGFSNVGQQLTLKNRGNEAVQVGTVRFLRPGLGILQSTIGVKSDLVPVDAFVLPGREMVVPRMVWAQTAVGGERWPSGLWRALAPWTGERRLLAWIRANDPASARAQVDRAANLNFQGVVVSVDRGDTSSVLAAVAAQAQARKIWSGYVFDASDFLNGTDLATPGDGKPCRTTQAAQRIVDRAMEWVTRNGMQVLVDATEWSLNCRSGFHDAHQADKGFPFPDGQAQARTALACVGRGVRFISHRDLRLLGATAVLDGLWSPAPQTGAEFAVAITRPPGLVPLAGKVTLPDDRLKNWIATGTGTASAWGFPLATRAIRGRAAATQLSDGSVLVVLSATQPGGVEAVVSTPFAIGTQVDLSTGNQATVGAEGTVTLRAAISENSGTTVTVRPHK
jgi:hypothetical protein